MTTPHDDDRDFDAFLRGEDDLSARLRQLPPPDVPAALDARILAQARVALREPLTAANDAAADVSVVDEVDAVDAVDPPRRAPWFVRVRAPLALAATVVIGVSLSLRWEGWKDERPAAVLSDAEPAGESAPAPAPAVEKSKSMPPPQASAPAVAADPAVDLPARPQRPVQAARRAPVAPPAAEARLAEDAAPVAAAPQAAAAPAPSSAPPSFPAGESKPGPAVSGMYASKRSAYERVVPDQSLQRFAPPGPALALPAPASPSAAPAPVEAARRAPSTRVEVSGSRITRADVQARTALEPDARARQWLDLLTELLDRHLDDDARDAWRQFRVEFPDTAVPAALQARIDALPVAQATRQ